MKTRIKYILLLLCSLSLSLSAVQAKEGDERPPHKDGQEARLLQDLLDMDDQGLANLRATIQRIEKMSPEEKAQIKQRIGKMRNMDPERVEAMREKYKSIPPEQRKAMHERWSKLTSEERDAWREKLTNMSHEERSAVFEKEGFLPIRGKKGQKDPSRDKREDSRPRDKREKGPQHNQPDGPPPAEAAE
ncbi:MAG: DUF3106 domain-containing protein [Opitutaceae bacterium]